jgi:hypothetical protein
MWHRGVLLVVAAISSLPLSRLYSHIVVLVSSLDYGVTSARDILLPDDLLDHTCKLADF